MGASESSIARYQKDKEARARALLTKTFSTNSGQKIAPACDDGVALIDRDLPSFEYATTIEPKISQRLKELSSGNLVLHVPFESISQEAKDLQQFLLRVLRVDYGLRGLRNLSGLHLKFLNCAVQLRLFEAGHYSKSPTVLEYVIYRPAAELQIPKSVIKPVLLRYLKGLEDDSQVYSGGLFPSRISKQWSAWLDRVSADVYKILPRIAEKDELKHCVEQILRRVSRICRDDQIRRAGCLVPEEELDRIFCDWQEITR